MNRKFRTALREARRRIARNWSQGPGLVEAGLWTVGFLLAQGAAACLFVGLLLLIAFDGHIPTREAAIDLLLEIRIDTTFLLTGVTTLGALLILVPGVRFRVGRPMRERLGLHTPRPRHVMLILGAVAPLAVVSNSLYNALNSAWIALTAYVPGLAPF